MPSKFKLDRETERGQPPRALIEVIPSPPPPVTVPICNSEKLCREVEEPLKVSDISNTGTVHTKTALPSISERGPTKFTERSEAFNESAASRSQPPDRDESIADKVQRYESFVEDTLRAKLRQIAVRSTRTKEICFTACSDRDSRRYRRSGVPLQTKSSRGRSCAAASTLSRLPLQPPAHRAGPSRCAP